MEHFKKIAINILRAMRMAPISGAGMVRIT
jgi:hypothetical protein